MSEETTVGTGDAPKEETPSDRPGMRRFTLTDFSIEEGMIEAAWLRSAVEGIRSQIRGEEKTLHYSIFSPWRKHAACENTEMVSKRAALRVVYLGTYSDVGSRQGLGPLTKLPKGLDLDRIIGPWLEWVYAQPEYLSIHSVLRFIAAGTPTTEYVLERLKEQGRSVSLRTAQRIAQKERESLSVKKPMHPRILKRILIRQARRHPTA